MRYLPRVDEAHCLGYGDCAAAAPDDFEVDEVARVVGESADDRVLEAAKACPADAISVIDADTGKQVYP
jgi:ferredoxin